MSTPLSVALNIGRLICDAQAGHSPLDVQTRAGELYLRYFASGCSRRQIAEALEDEAVAAGVAIR